MSDPSGRTLRDVRAHLDAGLLNQPQFVSLYWYDWFCSDAKLLKTTPGLVKRALWFADQVGLDFDAYYLSFKNCCPMDGAFYDVIRIFPIKGKAEGSFIITPRSGHRADVEKAELYAFGHEYKAKHWAALKKWVQENKGWLKDEAEHTIRMYERIYNRPLSDEAKVRIRARESKKETTA